LSSIFSVTNVNEAPTAISLISVAAKENTPGIVIGQLAVTDEDAGDSHTLTVLHDDFEMDGDFLRLKEGRSLIQDENDPITIVPVTAVDSGGLSYTEQIAIVVLAHPLPWQNEENTADANADGSVSPVDALVIINHINDQGSGTLPVPPPTNIVFFFDTNGDGSVSPVDVLIVINLLNTNGEGEDSHPPRLIPMTSWVGSAMSPVDTAVRRPASHVTSADILGDWLRPASASPDQVVASAREPWPTQPASASDAGSVRHECLTSNRVEYNVDRLIDELLTSQSLIELDDVFADWPTS